MRVSHMLRKLVSMTKLRMAKVTFEREVQRIHLLERDSVISRQCEQFKRRMEGILRKKDRVVSKEQFKDLDGILTSDSDLKDEVNKLGIEKVPNYVILGDIEMSECEK